MGLKAKLRLIGLASIVGMSLVQLLSGAFQSRSFASLAQKELIAFAHTDLKHLATSAYHTVKCQDESLREMVSRNLQTASGIVKKLGGVTLSGSKTWKVTNQLSKESTQVSIPVMSIGGRPLTGNTSSKVRTPVADDISGTVGGLATVFQRINKRGDMLRVATNVIGKKGNRAVGTYIPAVNPDGKPNPVVSTLLAGRTYQGMAYVVDTWCVTAYEPLRDDSGEIVGALFVGVKQENIPSLRNAITSSRIGKSGYIWVISCKPETKGQYVIPKSDGKSLLGVKDADGRYCVKEMMDKGMKQKSGNAFVYNYSWKDAGSDQARQKVVAATYYEPWGWLIGASAYEDEFLAPVNDIKASGARMLWLIVLTGLASTAAAWYGFSVFATRLSERLRVLTGAARAVADGDVEEADNLLNQTNRKAA